MSLGHILTIVVREQWRQNISETHDLTLSVSERSGEHLRQGNCQSSQTRVSYPSGCCTQNRDLFEKQLGATPVSSCVPEHTTHASVYCSIKENRCNSQAQAAHPATEIVAPFVRFLESFWVLGVRSRLDYASCLDFEAFSKVNYSFKWKKSPRQLIMLQICSMGEDYGTPVDREAPGSLVGLLIDVCHVLLGIILLVNDIGCTLKEEYSYRSHRFGRILFG
ncbi:hypothetical protein TNCV_388871 [Trichonephila clavipes]|nr:hypothetical protein TNCV_388871 [Trichonephila clavipes]